MYDKSQAKRRRLALNRTEREFNIFPSERQDKRFKAVFHNGKVVHFGSKYGETYIDHQDPIKRRNYIRRHRELNEDWNNPYTAGTLSRYILWEKPNLTYAINSYKKRFNLV